MRVTTITSAEGLSEIVRDWDALHAVSATATFFNTSTWCRLWWNYFGSESNLHLLAFYADTGALVGIAPLRATRDPASGRTILHFIGDLDLSDYSDLLLAPGYEERVIAALVDVLIAHHRTRLDLHSIPARSCSLRLLPAALTQRGIATDVCVDNVCPVLTLPKTWGEYLAMLGSKKRNEIARRQRRAGTEACINWHISTDPGVIGAELPLFYQLHRACGSAKAAFWVGNMERFFDDLVAEHARRGQVWLAFLHVDGTAAASCLLFDERKSVLLYNSGTDRSVGGAIGAGLMLLTYLINHAIEQGRERFDFLRGDEAYKFGFGAQAEPIYRLSTCAAQAQGQNSPISR